MGGYASYGYSLANRREIGIGLKLPITWTPSSLSAWKTAYFMKLNLPKVSISSR